MPIELGMKSIRIRATMVLIEIITAALLIGFLAAVVRAVPVH
jgi:hypothetical protein